MKGVSYAASSRHEICLVCRLYGFVLVFFSFSAALYFSCSEAETVGLLKLNNTHKLIQSIFILKPEYL